MDQPVTLEVYALRIERVVVQHVQNVDLSPPTYRFDYSDPKKFSSDSRAVCNVPNEKAGLDALVDIRQNGEEIFLCCKQPGRL